MNNELQSIFYFECDRYGKSYKLQYDEKYNSGFYYRSMLDDHPEYNDPDNFGFVIIENGWMVKILDRSFDTVMRYILPTCMQNKKILIKVHDCDIWDVMIDIKYNNSVIKVISKEYLDDDKKEKDMSVPYVLEYRRENYISNDQKSSDLVFEFE